MIAAPNEPSCDLEDQNFEGRRQWPDCTEQPNPTRFNGHGKNLIQLQLQFPTLEFGCDNRLAVTLHKVL